MEQQQLTKTQQAIDRLKHKQFNGKYIIMITFFLVFVMILMSYSDKVFIESTAVTERVLEDDELPVALEELDEVMREDKSSDE
jgi:hypothetical protein